MSSTHNLDATEANRRLLRAAADLAWWFGWGIGEIYALTLEELEDWLKEATRQIQAGYRHGG